jgi:O-antigen ligase
MMGAGRSVSDPNSFAGTIAFSLPLLVWTAVWTRSRLLRACVLVYALLATFSVIQTHSRSGLVLHALNVLFALAMLPGRRAKLGMAAVLAGLVVWLAAGQTDEAMDRYSSIFSKTTYTKESSTVGRIEGYRIAGRMFAENPLTGVGPGCWPAYRMRRIDGDKLMPHNLTGQVIATYGLAGTVPFVLYLGAVFVFAWRVRRRRAGSVDPWDRAVASLAAAVAFTLVLLLVSGLGAHNVDRLAWYLLPALLAVAARATDAGDPPLPTAIGAPR